jgi:hypothetical protein
VFCTAEILKADRDGLPQWVHALTGQDRCPERVPVATTVIMPLPVALAEPLAVEGEPATIA